MQNGVAVIKNTYSTKPIMGKPKKRIFKIISISITAFVVILIFINSILNYYLRKTLESAFNQELNAITEIDHVRINFFTSRIKIYGFTIIGKEEFKSDTLLHSEKSSIKLKNFIKEDNLIIIDEFILVDPKVNIINSEYGTNNWESALKKVSSNDSITEDTDFKLFVNHFIIENGELTQLDEATLKEQSLRSLNIDVLSERNEQGFTSDYKISLFTENEYITDSLKSTGVFSYIENTYTLQSNFILGNNQFDFNGSYTPDTISPDSFEANLVFDFNKTENNSGLLDVKISGQSFEIDSINSSLTVDILANQVNISNSFNENYYFNGNIELSYSPDVEQYFGFKSENIEIISMGDTISGSFDIRANDKQIFAKSNIYSSDSLTFRNNKIKTCLYFSSNLNGIISKETQEMPGDFRLSINSKSLTDYNNDMWDLAVTLNESKFNLGINYCTEHITGVTNILIADPQSYLNKSILEIEVNSDIKYLGFGNSTSLSPSINANLDSNNSSFKFPKYFCFTFNTKIDSISNGITDLYSQFVFYPDEIGLRNISMNIANGEISGDFMLINENSEINFLNNLEVNDFDLAALFGDGEQISGIINLTSNNQLFSIQDTVPNNSNSGVNQITIKHFKYKTGLFREYEIDEDYFKSDSISLTLKVNADSIELLPSEFTLNNALVKTNGKMNLRNADINTNLLIDIPDSYFGAETKLLLDLISKDLQEKYPQRGHKNRLLYLLEITGNIKDPDFTLYSD